MLFTILLAIGDILKSYKYSQLNIPDCNCNRVNSFFIANHSSDDSYVGKQAESEKENRYKSVQRICIRKASIGAPDETM